MSYFLPHILCLPFMILWFSKSQPNLTEISNWSNMLSNQNKFQKSLRQECIWYFPLEANSTIADTKLRQGEFSMPLTPSHQVWGSQLKMCPLVCNENKVYYVNFLTLKKKSTYLEFVAILVCFACFIINWHSKLDKIS